MKGFLRTISAMLLIVLLFSFCMWRYEKLALISNVTAYFIEAAERLEKLMSLAKPQEQEGDATLPSNPFDPNSNYADYNPGVAVDATLEETLRAGLTAMQSEIDLTTLTASKDEVKAAMAAITYSSPELFYLQSGYMISAVGDTVTSISPSYTCTASQLEVQMQEYRAALDEIVAGAPSGGSDFDKILYLHDYFIENYTYDNSLTIRDAYTLFTQKTGVCQAYMLGLMAAARELGIESLPVTSDAMKHAWNLVKLDGAWYHVDITWDDNNTLPTQVSYTYFLQSDAGLVTTDATRNEIDRHRDWVAAKAATDTKYDAATFREARTPVVKHEGVYYCTIKAENMAGSARGVILSGTDVTAMTPLTEITGGYWLAGDNRYYVSCYSDLAVYGGYLYYHSGNSISRISLAGGVTDYQVYLVTGLSGTSCIYGFADIVEGQISYIVADSPDAEVCTYNVLYHN